jgi:hypothetical protein
MFSGESALLREIRCSEPVMVEHPSVKIIKNTTRVLMGFIFLLSFFNVSIIYHARISKSNKSAWLITYVNLTYSSAFYIEANEGVIRNNGNLPCLIVITHGIRLSRQFYNSPFFQWREI